MHLRGFGILPARVLRRCLQYGITVLTWVRLRSCLEGISPPTFATLRYHYTGTRHRVQFGHYVPSKAPLETRVEPPPIHRLPSQHGSLKKSSVARKSWRKKDKETPSVVYPLQPCPPQLPHPHPPASRRGKRGRPPRSLGESDEISTMRVGVLNTRLRQSTRWNPYKSHHRQCTSYLPQMIVSPTRFFLKLFFLNNFLHILPSSSCAARTRVTTMHVHMIYVPTCI